MADPLIDTELASLLRAHGINKEWHLEVYACQEVLPLLQSLPSDVNVCLHHSLEQVIRSARTHPVCTLVVGAGSATEILQAVRDTQMTIGITVFRPDDSLPSAASLRAAGVMDVMSTLDPEAWMPVLKRGLDFRAFYVLELDHRCESKRLHNRELELLGQPPENMSDDLSVFQPPPLPVGPMSVYQLEEASDAFERAYIDRVQQLCGSAREAAVYLGVSSATLSRRLRRESGLHGTPESAA
jgi:hypothetical protein